MNRLIKNQTINIDNHDSGSGQPVIWGKGVHIHKRMNNDSYHGAEVIIPLDNAQNIKIKTKGKSSKIRGMLRNEIKEAFENKSVRKNFIIDVIEGISRYNDEASKEELHQILLDNANKIADYFKLKKKNHEEFKKEIDAYYLITEHKSDLEDDSYYIKQDIINKEITIGSNLEKVKSFRWAVS